MSPNGRAKQPAWSGLIKRVLSMPANAVDYFKGKTSSLLLSAKMGKHASAMSIDKERIDRLRRDLTAHLKIAAKQQETAPKPPLTAQEQSIVHAITDETDRLNRNNVTRTKAYYDLYRRHPELHWALLAHMVSRNGGWNMTDLQGEHIPRLISKSRAEELFSFLERANALIFQDAYPQLLLYEASVTHKRNFFHLLPSFHVSAFMKPIWDQFWKDRCSELLTVGLIVNEQHYIESRVVQSEPYKSLLDSFVVQAQTLLQLNVLIFPYITESTARLAGLVLETFSDVKERIGVGKQLYAILFGVPAIQDGVRAFTAASLHTGSRADYWPHLFANVKQAPPGTPFSEKLDGCKLLQGADRLYSPKLADAWKDRPVTPPDRYDWFTTLSAMEYFGDISVPRSFEITNESCFALNKLELAALAGQQL